MSVWANEKGLQSVGRKRKVYSLLGERGRFTVFWANEEEEDRSKHINR